MPCTPATYTVTTKNKPAWNGQLIILDAHGSATFSPTGASGPGDPVTVTCGTDPKQGNRPTMSFVHKKVRYKEATQEANNHNVYKGDADDDSDPIAAADTWTAEAAPPVPKPASSY